LTSLKPPSALERLAGSTATEATLTIVGALAGGPLAPLLPVLSNALASGRQRERVTEALASIDQTLNDHSSQLAALTDEQYKLINETVLAVLHTTSEHKLSYLRTAVRNALALNDLLPQEAVVLGRIVRDVSAEEAAFLVAHFDYERVQLAKTPGEHEQRVLTVDPDSKEGLIVVGLVSLGLLTAAEPTYDDSGLLRFSAIVAKLLALLRESAP
jgi:hypothetical protein